METKICTKCGNPELLSEFYKHKRSKNGLVSICKNCDSEETKKYYRENKEKVKKIVKKYRENNIEKCKERDKIYWDKNKEKNKEKKKEYHKEYYKANAEEIVKRTNQYRKNNEDHLKRKQKEYYEINKKKINEQSRKYWKENKNKLNEWQKQYFIDHREERNEYNKNKLRNDPVFRLNQNIRGAIYRSLKGNKNGKHWETIVGYDTQELKKHLESQFKGGMTWKNYGKWHIDHRVPISLFNITSVKCKGFKKCWSLENLQPMWAEKNISKSNHLFY